MRIAFYLYSLLAAAGIYVSELLIEVHLAAAYGKGGDTGLCGAADGFSCADAANSAFAELGGLPIAALGMAFYAAVFVMAAVARFREATRPALADTFLLGGALAVAYSIFLAVVSAVSVGKFCPLCMGLYAVNIGLFATALATHPAKLGGLAKMWRAPSTGPFWATAAVLAVTTIAAQGMYAHRAEAAARARSQARESVDALRQPKKFEVALGTSPARGPADAAIVVVEFSDFQCPYCRRLADALKAVSERMPGKVRYHFKHFPMDSSCNPSVEHSMHQDACRAAVAMVCADRAGQAWAMHDKLFENQTALGRDALVGYAAGIGIDVEAFGACLDDPTALAVVRQDIAQGIELGVQGTPMWFLNGWRQIGAREPEVLEGMFNQRLRADAAEAR